MLKSVGLAQDINYSLKINMKTIALEKIVTRVGILLRQHNWYLVTAESCTGGGLAQAMTTIAGSSAWFDRGFVTYSNVAKQELLDVHLETLEKYGAVSEQTVLEMVKGALTHSQAQVGVAISGIAGPTGGTPSKPIGTIWIAYASPKNIYAKCNHFQGDRRHIREQAVMIALQKLLQELE